MATEANHRTRTLWLAGALHGFTHIYQVALLPLYLPMQSHFNLSSVGQATLLVTVMMLSYFVPSYPMGVLADRFSRKKLLGFGLGINALGFVGLGFAPSYPSALACVVISGLGGSFYHPAATALIARLYPTATGKALGLAGIGAGVGFFLGPLYSGWRAAQAGSWRAPVIELGILGLIGSALFLWLAQEDPGGPSVARRHAPPEKMFPTRALWLFFIATSFAFSLRDFVGNSMGTLGSLYLQQAHGFTLKQTGVALSGIFLAGAFSNPLFGHLSDRGRIRWTFTVLIIAAAVVAIFPHVPKASITPVFMVYGFFFMGSYPMVEAALMESVHDSVRGRVFGFFITVGGLIGNFSHWIIGHVVEGFGVRGDAAHAYDRLYGILAMLILLSLAGLPCLHAIRKREEQLEPLPGVELPRAIPETPHSQAE